MRVAVGRKRKRRSFREREKARCEETGMQKSRKRRGLAKDKKRIFVVTRKENSGSVTRKKFQGV